MQTHINGVTLAYSDRGTGPSHRLSPCLSPQSDHVGTAREGPLAAVPDHHIDLRGHGESDAPLWRYTLEQSADDVNALLEQLSIQQAIFTGLSMGGYILFAFYRKYAARVKGLILADTKAQPDTAEGKDGRFQMAQTSYKKGPSAIADIMLPKLLSPETIQTNPDLAQQVREWDGWADERAAGCSKSSPARPQPMETPEA